MLVELVDADGLVYDQRSIHPDDLARLNAVAQAETEGGMCWLPAHTECVTKISYVAQRYRVAFNGRAAGVEIDPFTAGYLIRVTRERGWVAEELHETEPVVRDIYVLTADNHLVDVVPGDIIQEWRDGEAQVAALVAIPFSQPQRRSPVSGRWKGGR